MKFGQLGTFLLKNHAVLEKNQNQNVLEKLFPDPYLKNQN